jgi:predicted nucleic acid-binding protein
MRPVSNEFRSGASGRKGDLSTRHSVEAGDTLACSVVTLTKIYAGVRPKGLAFTERFLEGLEHYDFDSHLAKNEWSQKGER